jgi:branched-chain amino acid transport system substrate-binding protein
MPKFATMLAGAALSALAAGAAAQEFRIGFVTTLSGPGAVLGKHQVNGWRLGLEHDGWRADGDRLAGVPTRLVYADDQVKPEVGVREVDKLLSEHKVHLVAGFIASNVLMASVKPILDRRVPLLTTNAGATPLAGEACNPLIVSTSWVGDAVPEAMGKLLGDEKIPTIYMMAPNYQGGKDVLAGVRRTLAGPRIVGQTLFKLGEADFQTDISRIRAEKPAALFVFAPGGMGIAFLKQWAASGANREIRLFTVFTVDWATLPAIGAAAVGTFHTMHWSPDLDNAANRRFVRDYFARHGHMPSHFAAQAYDAARLVAAALEASAGKHEDGHILARALRKIRYESTRGPYEYNVNGMPIQNYYKREVIQGADGKLAIVNRGLVLANHKDAYWEKCPAGKRL